MILDILEEDVSSNLVEEEVLEDDFDAIVDVGEVEDVKDGDEKRAQEVAKLNDAIKSTLPNAKTLYATTKQWLNNITSMEDDFAILTNLSDAFKYALKGNLDALKDAFNASKTVLTKLTSTGETLLHYASIGNQVDVVQWLIGKGVPINATESKYNSTALHYAAQKGHLEMVKLLIDSHANFNCR